MAAAGWINNLQFSDLKSEKRFKIQDDSVITAPAVIIHMVERDLDCHQSRRNELLRSIHQLLRLIKYRNVIFCAQTDDYWRHLVQEVARSYPDICFYINLKVRDLKPPHTDDIQLYFYSGTILLHFSVQIRTHAQTGLNVYSEDPNDPTKKPWSIPPSSCKPMVVKWTLPVPTDMADATDPLVSRALYIRSFMERSRGDIRQWSWVWESEIENIQFVSSFHMEQKYKLKSDEIGGRFQVVFHGTDERSNVDSILSEGFDRNRVKRIRRGFSPAWTSSSFDKAFAFARKPGAVLMNRLLLGNTWLDNSRVDVAAPHDTKLCTVDSMYPSGHSSLPPPHYLQLGPREEDQVLTFAVITFKMAEDLEQVITFKMAEDLEHLGQLQLSEG